MLAYSTQISAPAGTGSQAFTGVGFTPKVLIFSTISNSTNDSNLTDAFNGYGFATATEQAAICYAGDDDVSMDADAAGGHSNAACIYTCNYSGTQGLTASIVSMDADGFTLNFSTTSSGAKINVLALGGNGITGAYIKQITTPGSTGSVAYTGFGFQPDMLMTLGTSNSDAPPSISSTIGRIGIGVCDSALNQIGFGGWSQGGPTNISILYDGSMFAHCDSGGSINQRMTVTALGADGFTGNWNVSHASGGYVWVLGIKGVSSKAGKTAMRTSTGTTSITGAGFTPKAAIVISNTTASGTSPVLLSNHSMLGLCGSTVSDANVSYGNQSGSKNSNCRRSQNTNKILRAANSTTLKEASISSYDSGAGMTISYSTADATVADFGYLFLAGDEPAAASVKRLTLLGAG